MSWAWVAAMFGCCLLQWGGYMLDHRWHKRRMAQLDGSLKEWRALAERINVTAQAVLTDVETQRKAMEMRQLEGVMAERHKNQQGRLS